MESAVVRWVVIAGGGGDNLRRLIVYVTRSTGTAHTSAKARLASAAVWRISMSSRFMSVNYHFPYLPTVTNPGNNFSIQMVIRIASNI